LQKELSKKKVREGTRETEAMMKPVFVFYMAHNGG
jgi:hypothetical protein